jgi:hypothetical protein
VSESAGLLVPETDATDLDIEKHGACMRRGLTTAILDDLAKVLEKWPDGRAGVRITGDPELARLLGPAGPVGTEALKILRGRGRPVRAVLFDKNAAADWSLAWHQDRTIAVRSRIETAGFGPWSRKQGVVHVEPPFGVIEEMLTVRIHLDPVDEDNAPLRIALGSHRIGKIAAADAETVATGFPAHACLADAGDVWLYRTPILHASHAARPGRRRRVLQVDYTSRDLPAGMEWLGIGA